MNLKSWRWWRNKPINLQETRRYLRDKLSLGGCDSPGSTSLVLLAHALNRSKSWVLSHSEYKPSPQENDTLQTSLAQLLEGFPLPYILGHWEFFGRKFNVTPAVLIPRPETELLVEKAIQTAQTFENPRIVDVGTGSGVIAISLAAELPKSTVLGLDLSLAALRLAQRNALRWHQTRISFLQSNLLTPLIGPFDLICANLPYIPRPTLETLPVSRWEPHLALDGGESGLDSIIRLLRQARTRLSPAGAILLETDSSLGVETLSVAQDIFPNGRHQLIQDLAGHDRIVEINMG